MNFFAVLNSRVNNNAKIEALRGTVRYLRTENAYLKGQDLVRDIQSLPPLPEPITRQPTPELEPSRPSDPDSDSENEEDARRLQRPTLRSLATETKVLYRDVLRFSSSPRVVDLSDVNKRRAEALLRAQTKEVEGGDGDNGGKHAVGKFWMPRTKTPAHQVLERKIEAERLSQRVRGLLDKASAIA